MRARPSSAWRSGWAAAAALAALLAAAPAPVRAGAPCEEETARWCSGKAPKDLLSCLQSHRADLSPACVEMVENGMLFLQGVILDCEPDAFRWCRNAGRGEPTATCLSRRQGELSPRCQEGYDLVARLESRSAAACAVDAARTCPDVKPGKGDVYICLLYRGTAVSADCRKAMLPR